MIKGIIFDMDGTILNTIDDIRNSVNYALKKFNMPIQSVQEIMDGVGGGAIHLIEDVVPRGTSRDEIDEVCKVYVEHYNKNSNIETGPYEGILPLLKTLKDQKFKLAVVSNKHDYLVKKLNEDTFEGYFDYSLGETKEVPIKPEPDMLYLALEKLDLKNHEVLFIGDSDVDMITATNASITSVGVTWGFRPKEVLIKYNAAFIIDHPNQLLDIIKEVNANGND